MEFEVKQTYEPRVREEQEKILASIDKKTEAAYRRAHGPTDPYASGEDQVAREMRLSRAERQLERELESGLDPLMAYNAARRVGDKDRLEIIPQLAAKYLAGDYVRAAQLQKLHLADQPESRRKARQELEHLKRVRQHLGTTFAIKNSVRR